MVCDLSLPEMTCYHYPGCDREVFICGLLIWTLVASSTNFHLCQRKLWMGEVRTYWICFNLLQSSSRAVVVEDAHNFHSIDLACHLRAMPLPCPRNETSNKSSSRRLTQIKLQTSFSATSLFLYIQSGYDCEFLDSLWTMKMRWDSGGNQVLGCSMSSLISLLSSWVYQTFPVSKGDTAMKRDYSRLSFTCMDCELGCLFVIGEIMVCYFS
jgi:hypothetical protein